MVSCEKCHEYKVPSCGYGRSINQASFWAGLVCPKCEPSRAGIQEEPEWWPKMFKQPDVVKEAAEKMSGREG